VDIKLSVYWFYFKHGRNILNKSAYSSKYYWKTVLPWLPTT